MKKQSIKPENFDNIVSLLMRADYHQQRNVADSKTGEAWATLINDEFKGSLYYGSIIDIYITKSESYVQFSSWIDVKNQRHPQINCIGSNVYLTKTS